MGKRFQAKKLNKDDHKGVKDTAGAVKKGEVEMNAAIALKASKAAGVFRNIKVK